jgi:hypothetical protein
VIADAKTVRPDDASDAETDSTVAPLATYAAACVCDAVAGSATLEFNTGTAFVLSVAADTSDAADVIARLAVSVSPDVATSVVAPASTADDDTASSAVDISATELL